MDRIYNINDEIERKKLNDIIQKWINDARSVHQKYYKIWDDSDNYLNGNTTPVGFTESHSEVLKELSNQNENIVEVKEFVSVQRARPNHESILGDFSSIRRRLQIIPTKMRYRNLAKVYQERIKWIENVEMLPETIYFPAMDNAFAKGLHWIEIGYNPTANKLRGKFDFQEISCRDVMVDPHRKSPFFSKARYFIHMYQLDREEAKMRFAESPFYNDDAFVTDVEYLNAYSNNKDPVASSDMATFYRIHFSMPIKTYYSIDENTGEAKEITEEEFLSAQLDPQKRKFTFEGNEELKYFIADYNTAMGVIDLKENELGMFTLIPLINIQTDSQLYPIGDVEMYKNLNDLLNVLITVLLDHAKRMNRPIIPVDPEVMEDKYQELMDAVEHGGPAPGAKGVIYPNPINQAIVMLVPWVLNWIQDVVSKHSASLGVMPAEQVAKETVQTLIAKDRQSHGRKDIMIRYTLTMLARAMVRMINLMDDNPDIFSRIDPQPGEFEYIPINQTWTEDEYLAHLAVMANIPVPKSEQEQLAFMEIIKDVRKKFENENYIQTQLVDGYVIDTHEFTKEQLGLYIESSGLSLEEFKKIYNPQPTKIKLYLVNVMEQDVDMIVQYGIDDDYENDKKYIANRALLLHGRGALSRLDLLKEMGVPNAEQLIKNADAEQQMIQLAKTIASTPGALQAVQTIIQNPKIIGALTGSGMESNPPVKQKKFEDQKTLESETQPMI